MVSSGATVMSSSRRCGTMGSTRRPGTGFGRRAGRGRSPATRMNAAFSSFSARSDWREVLTASLPGTEERRGRAERSRRWVRRRQQREVGTVRLQHSVSDAAKTGSPSRLADDLVRCHNCLLRMWGEGPNLAAFWWPAAGNLATTPIRASCVRHAEAQRRLSHLVAQLSAVQSRGGT